MQIPAWIVWVFGGVGVVVMLGVLLVVAGWLWWRGVEWWLRWRKLWPDFVEALVSAKRRITETDVAQANRRLKADNQRWWTRWYAVQSRAVIWLMVWTFLAGAAVGHWVR